MMGRELLGLLGIYVNWVIEPVANCFRYGNHLGIQPHGLMDTLEFMVDDIEEATGIRVDVPREQEGRRDPLRHRRRAISSPTPGIYTCMGYMLLFHELGLDYTFSTYASDGGNFGLFTSHEMIKRLNAKIYAEAKRLGVKWILGGECGHMWRVLHQYMDTLNGPADFLEVPKSPITGTVFENAKSTKMVHIMEFFADLIHARQAEARPGPQRPSPGDVPRLLQSGPGDGALEEPRYVLQNVCNHFFEMPENTIREQTFCCGGGAGLGTDENMEMRLRGGLPRGNAVRYVQQKHGVNRLAAICAIDRATLVTVCDYWAPGVQVTGITELVANAMVLQGREEADLRPAPGADSGHGRETGDAEGDANDE